MNLGSKEKNLLTKQEITLVCLKYLVFRAGQKCFQHLILGGIKMSQNAQGQMLYSFTKLNDVKEKGARIIVKGEDCYIWDAPGKALY